MKLGVGLGTGRRKHGAATISPSIQLSGSPYTLAENAAIGSAIGTLSVVNGSGSYTFTVTADPDSKFAINADGVTLETDAALNYDTATSHSVTIQADNGVDAPISRIFSIAVTDVLQFNNGNIATVLNAMGSGLVLANTSGSHYTTSPWFIEDDWLTDPTSAALQGYGFDTIRIGVPIAVVMDSLNGGPNDPDDMVNYIVDQLDKGLAQGWNQIYVMGINFPLFTPDDVLPEVLEDPYGADYALYLEAATRITAEIIARGHPTDRVAFDIWSEPSFIGDEGAGVLANYQNYRALCPDHTLIVQGGNAGTVAGLSDIDPADYDENVIFAFGGYKPVTFSHAGYTTPDMAPLTFPPGLYVGGQAQAITDMEALVDADGSLDAGQKAARKAAYETQITTYFSTPEDETVIDGVFDEADAFVSANSLTPYRMLMYEYGCTDNAPVESRANYYSYYRNKLNERGWHGCMYQIGGTFGIIEDATTIIPEIADAIDGSWVFVDVPEGGGEGVFSDDFEAGNFSKWATSGGTTAIENTIVFAGSNAAKLASQTGFPFRTADIGAEYNTIYSRFYLRVSALPTQGAFIHSLDFGGGANIVEVHLEPDGTFSLWRTDDGTPHFLGGGTATITPDTYTRIEVKCVVGAGSGIAELKVDGVVDQTYTGLTNNAAGGVKFVSILNINFPGFYDSTATGADVYIDNVGLSDTDYPGA